MRKKTLLLALAVAVACGFIAPLTISPFVIDGYSMLPTLDHGERVIVDTVTYRWREPRRGEIVVFNHPDNSGRYFVKRVVAVGEDVVEVRDWAVHVNGRLVNEDYVWGPTYGKLEPVSIPPGHIFVLGDNRNNSEDSRFTQIGMVPRSALIGRAVVLYWPLRRFTVLSHHLLP